MDCQFYQGDVTDLAFLANPFDLALDIGCLHSLPPEKIRSLFTPAFVVEREMGKDPSGPRSA